MRLKCIKLAGFKSFVDPTTASFPSNLCAVVGPNGCGKSNIIDAVRWVMGESSAKNLRGESMTDVIFNGSTSRKPVGQASIELVFDNSDGTVGGEYASFAEISIKRKVTRDGQSEYQLNGTKCRRRDITDIFLGTGLGPRSYAIIEQGMISRLIEAKPEELRIFIEEAAGISKYKERRRDTENRMRRTQENLERLTDIRDELERQLQHLKRQASAAERYREYKAEERQLRAQLQALQWRALDDQAQIKGRVIRDLELEVEACVTRQTALNTEIEKILAEHGDLNDTFNAVQGRFYSLGADIARIEQTIQHQNERGRQLGADLEQTRRLLAEGEEHLTSDTDRQQVWQEELLMLEPELALLQESEEDSATQLLDAEEAMHRWQTRWDEFNQKAADARQRAEVQQSRIQHLETALQRIQERVARLTEERNGLTAGSVEEEISLLGEQMAEYELQQETLQETLDGVNQRIDALREDSSRKSRELDAARGELRQAQGRFASLEALQQAALGQKGDATGPWLSSQGLESRARVAECVQVEASWQMAVETVLGPYLQAVVLDGFEGLSERLAGFDRGTLTLIDAGSCPAWVGQASAPTLASLMQAEPAITALVAGVYVAEDLPAALTLCPQLAATESVVTRDGLWLGPNWVRVAKDNDQQSGVLARQDEITRLGERMTELEAIVARLDADVQGAGVSLRQQEQQREHCQRESKEINRQHGELRAQLSARQVQVEQIQMRRARADAEIAEQREQFAQEQESLGEARLLLQDAIDAMEQDSDQRESLLLERDSNRDRLETARQRARGDRDQSHQLAMRVQNLRTQIDSISAAISRTRGQLQTLQERRAQLEQMLEEASSPGDDLRLELEALLEKRLTVEEELARARQALDQADQSLRRAEKDRSVVAQETQGVREKLEKARIEAQSLDVRRSTLHEQLQAAEYDLDEVLAGLPEGAAESNWEENLQQVAGRIQRLGPINLAAIDEFKAQSERKDYLDSQHNDLIEALETLENAIRKIDRETRSRFKETFDKVNADLQELFPRVFGGGHAYLEMTGDDLLDTGITIMARPPGKRNSTIHLLSGGEKALTAIALVFSIFKLNPAPFCMLDEVDAPLDDANVGRYARMVKEMSSQVQFIYITHNKIAMEMGDHLLGVTMHEPGVSRLVTVNVEEAAELAEIG